MLRPRSKFPSKLFPTKFNSGKLRSRVKVTARNASTRILAPDTLVQAEKTPYDIIYQEDIVTLRYYPPLTETSIKVDGTDLTVVKKPHKTPLVIVSPLGVNMACYDLFQNRSLVRYFRAKGFELYLINWGNPGIAQNHYNLETYFADKLPRLLANVRQHSGETKLSLHGWSLGGLFSVCYAGLGDPDIINMILVGSPCDYHTDGQLGTYNRRMKKVFTRIKATTGWQIHDSRKRLWRSPGWMNSLMFKLSTPAASIKSYISLMKNLHDEEYVSKHATNGAFLDNMLAYPGGASQDMAHYLISQNVLAKGRLPMNAANKSNPKDDNEINTITANLLLVCGDNDPIVTRDNSVALLDVVQSTDTQILDVSGGHLGILSGSSAPTNIWPNVSDWLSKRSN